MAHPKHDEVRQRYSYTCGYCGVTETDTGGELPIDHYVPVSAGGGNEEESLVYACMRCNLYKSDYTSATSNVNTIDRILHPQKDSIAEHFREDLQTGQLESLTQTGRFHITLLHLNLPPLIAFRLSRTRKRLTGQFLEETLQENAEQRVLIQILLRMIEYKSDEPS